MTTNSLILLGKRIKELRAKRGVSQEKLSEMCGISSRHISEIERGESNPSYMVLEQLSRSLNTPLQTILEFSHQKEPEVLRKDILSMTRKLEGDNLRRAHRMLQVLSE